MPSTRLAPVDGIRALACLLVLGYHTWEFAGVPAAASVAAHWTAGVDLFIVLSGFCLFLPFTSRPETFSLMTFWRHRIRRIVPAYYASMIYLVTLPVLLVVAWRLMGRTARWQPFPDAWQWLTHLTFTHLFFPSTWDGMNGSYWSLALEAQFYAAMPLLVWLYRRYGWKGLLAPSAFSIAWNAGVTVLLGDDSGTAAFLLGVNLPGKWIEFIAGALAACALAAVRTRRLAPTPRRVALLCYLSVAVVIVQTYGVRGHGPAWLDPLVLGSGAAILLFAVSALPLGEGAPLLARPLSARPVRFIALISYSFYLIHQPTEWYFSQLLKGLGVGGWTLWLAELTIGTAIVTTISWSMYRAFEAPFLRSRPRGTGDASAGHRRISGQDLDGSRTA